MRTLLSSLLLLALLVAPRPASADDTFIVLDQTAAHDGWRVATNVGLVTFFAAAMADNAFTAHCRGKSEVLEAEGKPAICTEANPLLRGVMERRGTVPALVIKGMANAAIAGAILAMRDHGAEKPAAYTAIGVAVMQTWVAWHNARALGFSFTVGGK